MHKQFILSMCRCHILPHSSIQILQVFYTTWLSENYIYSETSLLWTPLGQKKVSVIESCPHFLDQNVHNHIVTGCPDYSGVLISGGSLYRAVPLYTPTRNSTWPNSAIYRNVSKWPLSHLNKYIPQILSYINHLMELS